MCSMSLRPLAHLAFVSRHIAVAGALVGLSWLASTATASAEPFSIQQWEAGEVRRDSFIPTVSPFYGGGLERPFDEEMWRDSRSLGDFGNSREEPTGFIASMGRFGLQVDSTGSGPRVRGLAWSPTESFSIVAGGNLGSGDGVGASLSVRIGF